MEGGEGRGLVEELEGCAVDNHRDTEGWVVEVCVGGEQEVLEC